MSNPVDSARHSLALIAEVTYGITPDTPEFQLLRHTSCSLALTKSSATSGEVSPDRQIRDFRHGTKQVGGDIGFELSYGTYDDVLEAALCGLWIPEGLLSDDTISVVASDGSFNDSGNGFVLAGFKVGRIFEVSGFTTGGNNGRFKVVTVAAGKITVTKADGTAHGLTDEAAGDEVDFTTDAEVVSTGIERRSFTFERNFTDMDPADKRFHRYAGSIINTLNLTLSPDAMVTGSVSVIGQGLDLDDGTIAGATYLPLTTTRVFDAFTGSLLEGGSPMAAITEMSLTLENGVAPRFVLFSDETILPQIGQSNLTGSITVFFQNATMYEKFIAETPSSLQFQLTDLAGNSYIFNIPRVSYTGGQPDVASGGGSVMLTMPFQAIYDATADTNITITRIPYAAA